jgi:hypothetical protein
MVLAVKSLDAITKPTIGVVIAFDAPKDNISLQVNSNGFTSVDVRVQGSIDGVSFYNIGVSNEGSHNGLFSMKEKSPLVLYARADCINCAGTGTLDAWIAAKE